MNRTRFHFVKINVASTFAVVACVLLLGATRQASASGIGLSLNLGGTSISFGIGDAQPAPPAPTVIAREPAFVPPVSVASKPEPRPRFIPRGVPVPVETNRKDAPSHRPGVPVIRGQAPEKFKKPPKNYSPVDAARSRR